MQTAVDEAVEAPQEATPRGLFDALDNALLYAFICSCAPESVVRLGCCSKELRDLCLLQDDVWRNFLHTQGCDAVLPQVSRAGRATRSPLATSHALSSAAQLLRLQPACAVPRSRLSVKAGLRSLGQRGSGRGRLPRPRGRFVVRHRRANVRVRRLD